MKQYSKEKQIWDIVNQIIDKHGEDLEGLSIHEDNPRWGEERRKIYSHKGYCFELMRIEGDEETIHDVEDGYVYSFFEPWDEFKEAGIDKAIKLLSNYK